MNACDCVSTFRDGSDGYIPPAEINKKAEGMFTQAMTRAWLKRLWSRITGQKTGLMQLTEVVTSSEVVGGAYAGTHPIDIHQICGSESRAVDFDGDFRPLGQRIRERWKNIARAYMRKETLPPVELIQVGNCYFVRDGHHRISVARSLGQRYIDAEIIMFQQRPPLL